VTGMGDERRRAGNTSANEQLSLSEPRVAGWRRLSRSTRRSGRVLVGVALVMAVLAAASGAPASASGAVRPSAAESSAVSHGLRSWSGYIPSTDGVRLWVHSVGGGAAGARVIVLVHGGPGLSLSYLSIFDSLASPTRQIVSYDQRGAGLSTRPANGHYGLAAQISDLDAVRRWTGARQITILGHSWGGVPAAAYTATHPGHVAALVLLDAVPLNWAALVAGSNRRVKIETRLQREGLIPNPLPTIRHNSCLAQVKALTPAYLANPRLPVNRSAVWGSSCTQSTAIRTSNAFFADRGELPSLAAALGRWHGHALVMQGAKDLFGLNWLRTSVAELRSAPTQSVVVPLAGHFPWIERTSLVLRTVGLFTR
jgi:pimeloyl-ACP methyl ester carboxylesterase